MEILEKNIYPAEEKSRYRKELADLAEKEAKEEIKRKILELKEKTDNSMIKAHLGLVDIEQLADNDLVAFNEAIVNNNWKENCKDFNEYFADFMDYEKEQRKKSGYAPFKDSRCNFFTMIKHYLIDKAIEDKLNNEK